MKSMIIAALSSVLIGFAALNTVSAQDYQRQTTHEYRTNGYGGQHRTTITTTTSRDRYHHHPVNGYYREGTWYGYRTYHRPVRVIRHERYFDNDRRHNTNVDINIRSHRDLDRRDE
jgi:hypothetical protein